jgi:aspartyl-tRNA(Asn)/glutamyl-tRNA(Gln) amidotransferase subunit A
MKAGARLSDENISLWDEIARVQAKASFSSVESYAVHRQWVMTRAADYDQNVLPRIQQGANVSAAEYIVMQRDRAALVRAMDARLTDLDGLVLPTVPIVAPTLAEVAPPGVFAQKNLLLIRNPAAMNFFDLCAISLPLPREGGLPVGLMLVARNGQDRKLFRMAAAVERLFAA